MNGVELGRNIINYLQKELGMSIADIANKIGINKKRSHIIAKQKGLKKAPYEIIVNAILYAVNENIDITRWFHTI